MAQAAAVFAGIEAAQVEVVAVDLGRDELGELLGTDDLPGGVAAADVAGAGDVEGVIGEEDAADGDHAATAPEDGAIVPAVFLADLEPAGAAARDGQGPAAHEGVVGGRGQDAAGDEGKEGRPGGQTAE
ncbi:MAG: hypothetical protein M5U12_17835 [Verrucomicrobia bacterium]|nr:hypothetical protein [Verrucomicrobiota bacterium]